MDLGQVPAQRIGPLGGQRRVDTGGDRIDLDDILDHVNNGAKVALLGLFGQAPTVDVNQLILKGLTVKGIYGREMFDTWYKAVAMLGSGLDVAPVITHRFGLEHHTDAFAVLRDGDASKVVLEIGSG